MPSTLGSLVQGQRALSIEPVDSAERVIEYGIPEVAAPEFFPTAAAPILGEAPAPNIVYFANREMPGRRSQQPEQERAAATTAPPDV